MPVHITLTLDTNNFATLRRLKFLIVCKTLLSNRCLSHYEWHILVMEPWPNKCWYFSVISIEPEYLFIDLHVFSTGVELYLPKLEYTVAYYV